MKKLLRAGMISLDLPSMNFLNPWREYLSPSAWLSSTPAALFSLVTLTSGLVVMLRTSCITQIPTATPVVAKIGYASGRSHLLHMLAEAPVAIARLVLASDFLLRSDLRTSQLAKAKRMLFRRTQPLYIEAGKQG